MWDGLLHVRWVQGIIYTPFHIIDAADCFSVLYSIAFGEGNTLQTVGTMAKARGMNDISNGSWSSYAFFGTGVFTAPLRFNTALHSNAWDHGGIRIRNGYSNIMPQKLKLSLHIHICNNRQYHAYQRAMLWELLLIKVSLWPLIQVNATSVVYSTIKLNPLGPLLDNVTVAVCSSV